MENKIKNHFMNHTKFTFKNFPWCFRFIKKSLVHFKEKIPSVFSLLFLE